MDLSRELASLMLIGIITWIIAFVPQSQSCPALEELRSSPLAYFIKDSVFSAPICPNWSPSLAQGEGKYELAWSLPEANVVFIREYNLSAFMQGVAAARRDALPSLYNEILTIRSLNPLNQSQYLRANEPLFFRCSSFSFSLTSSGRPSLQVDPITQPLRDEREDFEKKLINFNFSDPCRVKANCSIYFSYKSVPTSQKIGHGLLPATIQLEILAISTDGPPPTRDTIDAFLRHVSSLDPKCDITKSI